MQLAKLALYYMILKHVVFCNPIARAKSAMLASDNHVGTDNHLKRHVFLSVCRHIGGSPLGMLLHTFWTFWGKLPTLASPRWGVLSQGWEQTTHLGFAKVGSFDPRVGSIFFQGIQVNVDFVISTVITWIMDSRAVGTRIHSS